jgi:hypothetical protein
MQFKFLYRRAARESFRDGKLTQDQYDQLMQVLRHPIRNRLNGTGRTDLLIEVEKYTYEQMPKEGINWEAIIQWLKDHWFDILKLLLSLLVLLEPAPIEK